MDMAAVAPSEFSVHWPDLPVFVSEQPYSCVYGKDGRPVWPVSPGGSGAMLERYVSGEQKLLTHVEIETLHTHKPADAPALSGLVVAYGSEVELPARLYAHLTTRDFMTVRDISELPENARIAVVVLLADKLDLRLLERLYDTSAQLGIGLVYGRDRSELLDQVLVRSAAVRVGWRPRPKAEVQHAGEDVRGTVFDAELAARLKSRIGAGASVVAVVGHSDGIDAGLDTGVLACPLDDTQGLESLQGVPPCVRSGVCGHFGISIADGLKSGQLFTARSFKATIIIWAVCGGMVSADGPVDRAVSFVHRLLQNHNVGALVTTWHCAFNPENIVDISMELLRGTSLGTAIGRHNARPESTTLGKRVCLIGDPALRIAVRRDQDRTVAADRPSSAPSDVLSSAYGAPNGAPMPLSPATKAQSILEYCVERNLVYNPQLQVAIDAQTAIRDGRTLPRPGSSHVQDVLTWLLFRGPVYPTWLAVATDISARSCRCPHSACGAQAIELRGSTGISNEYRLITACPNCFVVADVSERSDLGLRFFDSNNLMFTGTLPRPPVAAGVLVWSQRKKFSQTWPTQSSGQLERYCVVDVGAPAGVATVAVFVVHDDTYQMLSRKVRLPTNVARSNC
jgi:hypothetical protein